jgi:hypothetical protein
MLNPKRLSAVVFLTCALGLTAWADCPAPGIMGGPPCASATQSAQDDSILDGSTAPGIMNGPPVLEAPSVELALAEIALNVLMLF